MAADGCGWLYIGCPSLQYATPLVTSVGYGPAGLAVPRCFLVIEVSICSQSALKLQAWDLCGLWCAGWQYATGGEHTSGAVA